jgi:hypothetical protein
VETFHAFRCRANESFKYKAMYPLGLSLAVLMQSHAWVFEITAAAAYDPTWIGALTAIFP